MENECLSIIAYRLKKIGWEWESRNISLKKLIQDDYNYLDNKFQNQENISYEEIGFALDLMRAVLNDEMK